jgi:hypothetical protein
MSVKLRVALASGLLACAVLALHDFARPDEQAVLGSFRVVGLVVVGFIIAGRWWLAYRFRRAGGPKHAADAQPVTKAAQDRAGRTRAVDLLLTGLVAVFASVMVLVLSAFILRREVLGDVAGGMFEAAVVVGVIGVYVPDVTSTFNEHTHQVRSDFAADPAPTIPLMSRWEAVVWLIAPIFLVVSALGEFIAPEDPGDYFIGLARVAIAIALMTVGRAYWRMSEAIRAADRVWPPPSGPR